MCDVTKKLESGQVKMELIVDPDIAKKILDLIQMSKLRKGVRHLSKKSIIAGFSSIQREVWESLVEANFHNSTADGIRGKSRGCTTHFLTKEVNIPMRDLVEREKARAKR
jgi:hypothetical protein